MASSDTPGFIYGTAWKEEATAALATAAVEAGFRGIDTANQPRHYQEALVGEALEGLEQAGIPRSSLFLQTKFTPANGHDHRIPYDTQQALAVQVNQSFQSSLINLKTDFVDSYLLHGPYSHPGLGHADWEVWEAMEEIHGSGGARMIGISNVNHLQLAQLLERASVEPTVVQNRCFANRGWDREVREICRQRGIMYQGFSLLTANVPVLGHPKVKTIAERLSCQPAQVVFRFALQVGMVPLTGTTQKRHMQEDLAVFSLELTDEEVDFMESIEG